jgi:hypothetical protein
MLPHWVGFLWEDGGAARKKRNLTAKKEAGTRLHECRPPGTDTGL